MSLLIIGATGTLGRQLVQQALEEGYTVRCLVRSFRRGAFLKEWGTELIYGDLTIPETLPPAFKGITAVIDASTTRANEIIDINQIDWEGKLNLLKAAKIAKVDRFIFFSILNSEKYPYVRLMHLKTKFEQELINSKIDYTIFKLAGFFQGLIGQYALPILDKESVWVTGESTPISYIDTQNAAKFVLRSLIIPSSSKKILPLVGAQAWTSLEIINLCEKLSGQNAKIVKVPINFLKFTKIITSCFEWGLNVSNRLAFAEILASGDRFIASMKEACELLKFEQDNLLLLEDYLKEYYIKIIKKLRELNIEEVQVDQNQTF
uniref:Ycf39 n=1 Tax=Sciadococcus taiwanensis TaxID=3028030 RepID=A0A9Y1I265_9RHOD|nr:Ycf39 [Sciadococcus taiwanensis]